MNYELTKDYYLERFLLGELPEEESVEIQKMIADDSALQTKIEDIESSNQEILARYLPSNVQAQIENRMEETLNFPLLNRLMNQFSSMRRIIYISSALITVVLLFALIQPGGKDKIGTFPFDPASDVSLVKGFSEIDFSCIFPNPFIFSLYFLTFVKVKFCFPTIEDMCLYSKTHHLCISS